MEVYYGVHAFLTSQLNKGGWWTSRSGPPFLTNCLDRLVYSAILTGKGKDCVSAGKQTPVIDPVD
jgi:hypothetical protein